MVSSLRILNFKECIPYVLALISKWSKLLPLRYFSLKYIHSSTKFTALEMTYLRNDLLFFAFLVYSILNCDTSHWFLYVASFKRMSSLRLFLIILTELDDAMPTSIYFAIYKSCCSQVFYGVAVLKIFGKLLETHTWWRTILAKLLSCPLHRARLS